MEAFIAATLVHSSLLISCRCKVEHPLQVVDHLVITWVVDHLVITWVVHTLCPYSVHNVVQFINLLYVFLWALTYI